MAVVYLIEEERKYLPAVQPLFHLLDQGRLFGISSYLTLLEVLVKPLRRGEPGLVRQYTSILTQSRNVQLYAVDREVAEKAAEIRAKYKDDGIRIPDAVQLATAICQRADVFVTNDKNLRKCSDLIEMLFLDEFVAV